MDKDQGGANLRRLDYLDLMPVRGLGNSQRVNDPFELPAYLGRKSRRGRAYASDFSTAVEIM